MSHPNRTLEDCKRIKEIYPDYNIGIIVEGFGGLNDYEVGEYVLFKYQMAGSFTVETPMSEDYYSDGHCGGLRTYCTIACVPHNYVKSIENEDVHICPHCRFYYRIYEGHRFPCWVYDYCGSPAGFRDNFCEAFEIIED